MQTQTFYQAVGGEEGLRRLVTRFYQIMDSEPKAAGIRAMHQADLSEASEKLFLFLSGWMGGPPLYIEKYGHPMLRARHLPPLRMITRSSLHRGSVCPMSFSIMFELQSHV
jgi:hemoglobin